MLGKQQYSLSYATGNQSDKNGNDHLDTLGNFRYTASGFNNYGDEVSHLNFPNEQVIVSDKHKNKMVNTDFMKWLADIIHQYEQAGVEVIMLPPVCVESYYNNVYNANIANALEKIGHPYIVEPSYMMLDDSCYFNTGYHINRHGVLQNTSHIIKIMREHEGYNH